MISLLEEEYNSTSQKYILHLTMGANDTVADLPSSMKPFNSSNYSCSFDYGEPAEGSTAVNEISGKLYTYGNGEWYEPEPAVETKIPVVSYTGNVHFDDEALYNSPVGYNFPYSGVTEVGAVVDNVASKSSIDIMFYILNDDVLSTTVVSVDPQDSTIVPDKTILVFIGNHHT